MERWQLSWFDASSGTPSRAAYLATEVEAPTADAAKQAALRHMAAGEQKKYRLKVRRIQAGAPAPAAGEPVEVEE